jgi:GT2 family glycosyltransferase
MMRRAVYQEVGCLDEVNLPVAFNDVDMCLRVGAAGYQVVYTPYAVLHHHESVTKTIMIAPGEERYMQRKWAHVISSDPYYNVNLTRKTEDFALNLD